MVLPTTPAMEPFNFLGQIAQPAARAPIEVARPKPRKFVNALGRILDAVAVAGGAQPGYKANVQAAQKQAELEAIQTAQQRLLADPNDQEAFTFIAQRDLKAANELRAAARGPQPEFVNVSPGTTVLKRMPDGSQEVAFTAPQSASPSADIQLLDRLTKIFGGDERAAAEYMANLKLPPEFKTMTRGDGGQEAFMVNRAPAVPSSPDVIWSNMVQRESRGQQFDAKGRPLTSPKGAVGVAQVMPGTAPEAAQLAGLPFDETRYRTDPEYNAALGRAYFNEMLRQFGDPARAAAAYNAGPEAVRRAVQRGGANWLSLLPKETQDYVPAVLGGGPGIRKVAETPDKTQTAEKGKGSAVMTPAIRAKAEGRLGSIPSIRSSLAAVSAANDALAQGGLTGIIAGRLPSELEDRSNIFEKELAILRSQIRGLTKVEGEGSISDLETKLANAQLPGRTDTAAGRAAALRAIERLLNDTEADYRRRLGVSVAPVAPPAVGETRKGYTFLGGDPANPQSWRKVAR